MKIFINLSDDQELSDALREYASGTMSRRCWDTEHTKCKGVAANVVCCCWCHSEPTAKDGGKA